MNFEHCTSLLSSAELALLQGNERGALGYLLDALRRQRQLSRRLMCEIPRILPPEKSPPAKAARMQMEVLDARDMIEVCESAALRLLRSLPMNGEASVADVCG